MATMLLSSCGKRKSLLEPIKGDVKLTEPELRIGKGENDLRGDKASSD
jgi:hypothetical protein